jgi:hypothetical protein
MFDRRRRAGLFNPHPHQNEWSEMSIYFTFELPETRAGHTGLAVVVDKFSEEGHFLYT